MSRPGKAALAIALVVGVTFTGCVEMPSVRFPARTAAPVQPAAAAPKIVPIKDDPEMLDDTWLLAGNAPPKTKSPPKPASKAPAKPGPRLTGPQPKGVNVRDIERLPQADDAFSTEELGGPAVAHPNGFIPEASRANRLTLHLDGVDVRKALEMISRQSPMSMAVGAGVSGQVTADLRDVTVDQALRAIATSCNLTIRRDGGIVYVQVAEREDETGAPKRHLGTRVYRLNYVNSTDVQTILQPFLSKDGVMSATPPSAVGIESSPGEAGGNTLAGGEVVVVRDYEETLEKFDEMVPKIDVQPVQVLIEAVLMQVTLDKGQELGVNFAVLDNAGLKMLAVVGNGAITNAGAGFAPASMLTAGGKLAGTSNSGFAADTGGLKFGFVDSNVTGFIRALSTCGSTEVLAAPRLLVLNKQKAEIQLGQRLGYRTLTQNQTSTIQKVEFMNVGTQLRLRPFISSDGMIRLEIHPERSAGEVIDNIPQTNTSQVTTNVLVPDGATIVIGGLMENFEETQLQSVPFLGTLPIAGALFRSRTRRIAQRELIVLLTPRIWHPELDGEPPPVHRSADASILEKRLHE